MRSIQLFLVLFFVAFSGIAQEYSYRYYSISDGLPQTQVTTLFQDSKGFIWVGTKGGVSRFDGVEFQNFGIEDGLTSRIVCNISEGRDGKIYILCDHGFSVFDGNKVTPHPFTGGLRAYMDNAYVVHDFNGNIWLSFILLDKWDFLKFRNGIYTDAKSELSLPDSIKVNSLAFNESDSSLLLGTELSGVLVVKENSIHIFLNYFKRIGIKMIFHDSIIFRATLSHKKPYHYRLYKSSIDNPEQIQELADSVGTHFQFINANILLFSAYNNNFFIEYKNGVAIPLSKKYLRLNASLIDSEGNLWAGSETGLYRLKSKAFLNFTKESGIKDYVWSIVEDREENIWFASFLNGLSIYDGKSFSNYEVVHCPEKVGSFYRGSIKNQYGDLLFPCSQGVIKYDGLKFHLLSGIPKAASLFIYEDTLTNKLLISSANHGLVIREGNGTIRNFNISPGPIKEYISTINMDKYGRYWLGGFYGMTILDGDSLIKLPTKELPYSEGAISSYKDSLGNLWFGTTSGLYLYDYNTFRKIGPDKINSYVMSLAGMAGNKLFIGMVKGMGILDLKKFYSTNEEDIMLFNHSNGFLGEECKQNGVFTDSKGYTWVATSDRVIRIDPKEIRKNKFKPRIYIKSVRPFSKKHKLETNLQADTSIVLPWFKNDLRFDYHAISHTSPEGVRYKYRLDGYDDDWSEPTSERYATYTNLKYGDYEFQVKACNCDGVWCESPAVFSFSISPAFWQTKLFLFGSNILFLAFIISGILYFLKKKRIKREEKDLLDKKFTELQLKTIKNQMDPHFTFNAINSLGALIFTEKKEKAYDFLVNFSRLIRTTVESSDRITRSLKKEIDFTQNYLALQQFRFKDNFEYDIHIEEGIDMETKVPRMVIQTHVENALKHGLVHSHRKGMLNTDFHDFN